MLIADFLNLILRVFSENYNHMICLRFYGVIEIIHPRTFVCLLTLFSGEKSLTSFWRVHQIAHQQQKFNILYIFFKWDYQKMLYYIQALAIPPFFWLTLYIYIYTYIWVKIFIICIICLFSFLISLCEILREQSF